MAEDLGQVTEAALVTERRPQAPNKVGTFIRARGAGILLLVLDIASYSAMAFALTDRGIGVWAVGAFVILANGQAGLYRSRFTLSILNDLPLLAGRYMLASGLALLAYLTFRPQIDAPAAWAWLVVFVVMVAVRGAGYAFIRFVRRRRLLGKTTIIVGCGQIGQALAHAIKRERDFGLHIIGFVDSPPPGMYDDLPLPLLGPMDDLRRLMEIHHVQFVLVAFTHASEENLVSVIRSADRLPASIAVVPRLFELTPVGRGGEVISDIPLTRLHRPAFRSPTWPLKRLMDIVVSGVALVVLSPLLLLLALIDRIVDGPHVIFKQERVGIDGEAFEVYKFRSLRPASSEESATKWNVKHDDRLSWFGKILRKSSLDELPQLWNILRGDMSLVGPRPERPHFVEQFETLYPYYGSRDRVPCGLTGWAQIHGLRGDTSVAARARYDNFYIENWSLWLDIKIIIRTFTSLFKGSG